MEQLNTHQERTNMANNFFRLRELSRLSIPALSEATGIACSILEDIEQGKDFDTGYFLDLCSFYHLRPSVLFCPLFSS